MLLAKVKIKVNENWEPKLCGSTLKANFIRASEMVLDKRREDKV